MARRSRATREALVTAAVQLIVQGGESAVGVAEAAEIVDVSRATAYRYFPTKEILVRHALLELSLGRHGEAQTGLAVDVEAAAIATVDHVERIGRIVRLVAEWSYDRQHWLRLNLRTALEDKPDGEGYRRPGHRRVWIALAVDPLRGRLPPQEIERLAVTLYSLMGVDPVIPLVDLAGCDRDTVIDTLEWAARRLTEAVLAHSIDPFAGGPHMTGR